MQVVVVEPGNLPSTRLVLTQMLEALKNEGVLDWRLTRERDSDLSTLRGADIVILFRCSELQTVVRAKLAARNGAIVMYATDDNLLEVPKETRDGAYFQSIPVRWIISTLISKADAILVYSAFARDYFSKITTKTVLLEHLPAPYPGNGSIKSDRGSSETVVGYAGTSSHATDFEPVIPAIRKLLETPNFRFDFIGYCPPELIGMERVSITPWIDRYENYLAELAQRRWDIGLAPLKDTLFNNCKTNLKFREYAAFGIAGIYSDTPLYRACVRTRKTAF